MNYRDYKYYTEKANEILSDDFNLESHLGKDTIARILYEMKRVGEHGRGLGGDSFRHRVSGLFEEGVYVYADNYRVGVSFASDPAATVTRGCQDSCAHGNPWPRLSTGNWVSVNSKNLPDNIRNKVLKIATQLLKDASRDVIVVAKRIEAELAEKTKEQEKANQKMLDAWS